MRERKSHGPANIVGAQVRKIRYQQGLTQPALAERCQLGGWDVSRETLAKIESRLRAVTDIEILALARALKVPYPLLFPDKHAK